MRDLAPKRALLLAALGVALLPAHGAMKVAANELADMSLEELSNLTVTSVSKREERVLEAAASIFVITAEDIRRSGANSLFEALRLAPNLQVVRGDANQYVATARGGLAGTADKMLVLVDGRTIYTPLFSGVFSDAQDVMLEDVERIEVISGPGSTLWGANAVNGVINVITKPASQTRGVLAAAGGGNAERVASVRAGAGFEGGDYRAYARYGERNSNALASGASAHDSSERWQTGFRADGKRGEGAYTVQGDAYAANVDNLGGPRDLSGWNALGRWSTKTGEASSLYVQAYFDHTDRLHTGSFKEKRDTADVEMQSATKIQQHAIVWGAGFRSSRDSTETTPTLGFVPTSRTLRMGNLFGQDEIAITKELQATVGVRAERTTYTGLEWLPNLRLAYTPAPDHVLWGAVTRTVRTPSRIDRDAVVPGTPPYLLQNNDTFDSEVARVAEVGYRGRMGQSASISLTAFHHEFSGLRILTPIGTHFEYANGARTRLTGLEGWGDFVVSPSWRVAWGFTAMHEHTDLDAVNFDAPPYGNNPRRTAMLRSLWNVTPAHELDASVRYMGDLPTPVVPAYTLLDVRWGWRVSPAWTVSLNVDNLFDRKYSEFGTAAQRAVFERTAFLKVTLAY
ncbi:MAG: TonB-dependent receptor plug domain-containing protein [Usitatibacter sp.]